MAGSEPVSRHGITGTVVLRPSSAPWLTGLGILFCVGGLVSLATDGTREELLRFGPLLALGALAVWAMFWRPVVAVSDGEVVLRNVLRTIRIPWPSLNAVETRFALVLHTSGGRFTAWAAPASGGPGPMPRAGNRLENMSDQAGRGTVRASERPGSPSGDAATVVHLRWAALRDAGYLDRPHADAPGPSIRWHWWTIGAALALVAWAVAAMVALG